MQSVGKKWMLISNRREGVFVRVPKGGGYDGHSIGEQAHSEVPSKDAIDLLFLEVEAFPVCPALPICDRLESWNELIQDFPLLAENHRSDDLLKECPWTRLVQVNQPSRVLDVCDNCLKVLNSQVVGYCFEHGRIAQERPN